MQGTQVADFIFEEPLGKGGFGCVYAATRRSDGVRVAIKEVPLWRVHSWGLRNGQRVPLEAALLQKVQHVPGVIGLYDVFLEWDYYYMVMEYVPDAISMFDYVEKFGKLPGKAIKRMFKDLVTTVDLCLQAGVSHKDIKPENALIYKDPGTGNFEIRLIDFGCGEAVKNQRGTDTGGTLIYWPPEYLSRGRFLHVPATVWSLGTLLYYLLCRRDAFKTKAQIERNTPYFARSLPSACRDLIKRCLTKNPWDRLSLQGILHHPWLTGEMSAKIGPTVREQTLDTKAEDFSQLRSAAKVLRRRLRRRRHLARMNMIPQEKKGQKRGHTDQEAQIGPTTRKKIKHDRTL
ncbi:serine/threonine-protein kinase pim-1-like [Oratosquilla oratoria]|uniref:serine/threonine-protein kinase pim-1-like n=1 Tax=Oratosquilla oratoria TaxID=337810 RepID=UPI003F76BD6F